MKNVVAGNDGALRDSGVAKLKELFAQELDVIQKAKLRQAGVEPDADKCRRDFGPIEGTVIAAHACISVRSMFGKMRGESFLGVKALRTCR